MSGKTGFIIAYRPTTLNIFLPHLYMQTHLTQIGLYLICFGFRTGESVIFVNESLFWICTLQWIEMNGLNRFSMNRTAHWLTHWLVWSDFLTQYSSAKTTKSAGWGGYLPTINWNKTLKGILPFVSDEESVCLLQLLHVQHCERLR